MKLKDITFATNLFFFLPDLPDFSSIACAEHCTSMTLPQSMWHETLQSNRSAEGRDQLVDSVSGAPSLLTGLSNKR